MKNMCQKVLPVLEAQITLAAVHSNDKYDKFYREVLRACLSDGKP